MNVKLKSRADSDLLARDLMQDRVRCVRPDDLVYDVVRMLVRHGISGAPVVDPEHRIIGMLSEKDCIQALMRAVVHDLPSSRVSDVMSTNLYVAYPETHLLTIAHMFLTHPIRRIPVVDEDDRIVGVISRRDLLKKAVQIFEASPSREAALLYLSALEDTSPPT